MNKYQILKQSIMLSIIFGSIIFSISMASADNKHYISMASVADTGYYWDRTTGVSIGGFTTGWSSCSSTTPQSGYRVTSVGSAAASCTNGALTRTTVGDMFLEIFPIAYTSNTLVNGVNASFYLGRPTSGTTTYRIDLGYVQRGVFTSFGYVTRALTSSSAYFATTNLNTIRGTAPAGSNLALKLSVTTLSKKQTAQVNLGTNGGSTGSNSGRFYVSDTALTLLQLNIVSPSDVTTVATGTYTTVNLGTPTVTGGELPYATTNNAPPGGFSVGTTTVTWNTIDFSGGTATDTQLVTITPQPPPTKTYYWDRTTGVSIAGFTTDWSSCSSISPENGYRVTSLGNVSSSCTNIQLTRTNAGDLFLAIFPTAYSSDTQITGKTNARFYLRSNRGSATYRFDFGYAQTGTFTSLGSITQTGVSTSGTTYIIDLSSISGTAPAGSNLALKVSVTTSKGGSVYMGTNGGTSGSNSGRFNISEAVESAPTYDVKISASPISSDITSGNSYIYNITINNTGNANGNYTLSVTDSDIGNFIGSILGNTTMQINSGGSAMTTLNVTARPGETTGALDNTTVTVISVENPAYSNSTRVQTTVASLPRYDVSIRATPISSDINPGNSYLYNITVNNTGNTKGNYTLSVTDSDTVNFTISTLGNPTMPINSGGSANTILTVTARTSATIGSIDNTTVTVISDENPVYTNSTTVQTTDSGPTYNVSIYASPISTSITAGNYYLYNIIVDNTGNANGNYILSLTDSDTVNFTNSTLGITTMQITSGGSAMTTLNVTARTSAIIGAIDNITVTAISVENSAYSNSTGVETTVASAPVQGPNCFACHAGAE